MLNERYEDVRHSRHGGRIGYIDQLLDVVRCAWCAVGYLERHNPKPDIQQHFESEHQNIHSSMWEETRNA